MGQDPDAIQREIEQTRAELAQTIDLIAERVSPKRAASRGAAKVKDAFSRPDLESADHTFFPPGGEPGEPGTRIVEGGEGYTGATTFATTRTLRKDRVALVAVAAAAVVAFWVWRRRRS